MVVNFTLETIDNAAKVFLAEIKAHKIIAFHGEMGAGKTTFIQAVCNRLKVEGTAGSPTFSIINEYISGAGTIYHMDLYRLKDEEEAVNAGVEEAFYSGNMCFVEWPEKAPGIFPEYTVHCYLSGVNVNERKLIINV